jgi:hypothetical protein
VLTAKDGDLIPCNSLGASALSTPYGEEEDEDDESVLSGLAPTLCVLGAVCGVCVVSTMPR